MDLAVFDDLALLGDATRSRMLLLLERHELTVGELCAIMQLPQSTVSRHLKMLADAAWIASRREGTSRYYRSLQRDGVPAPKLWDLLRDEVVTAPAADQDARRARTVLARRQTASQEFFASGAGRWDRLRGELFGPAAHLPTLAGLLDDRWVVGDLGCGTGAMAASLAPFVARVVAVDRSADMLQAAASRLREHPNVELKPGELEALPIADATLDAATLILVLHHVPDPAVVLADVARTLRPGGRLLLADMLPHDREEYRQQYGHVWLGFPDDHLRRLLAGAGFERPRIVALPADSAAQGPALFAATAVREVSSHQSGSVR